MPLREILNKIPLLGQHVQQKNEQVTPVTPDATQILSVIDKAVDVVEQRPDPVTPAPINTYEELRQIRNEKSNSSAVEAEKIREEIRAEIKRLGEENRLNEEKRQREQAEAKQRATKAAFEKASSWEVLMKPYCNPNEDVTLNTLTRSLLSNLLNFGKLHTARAECAALVSPMLEAWDVAFEARGKISRKEFKKLLLEDIEDNAQRLRDGYSDLRPLTSVSGEAFEKQYSILRGQCKERQQEVAKSFNPVLFGFAEKLQAVARKLVNERFIAEKSEAEAFGILFEPSRTLKYLLTAGFDFRGCVERNWQASQLVSPRTTLYGLLDPNTSWE